MTTAEIATIVWLLVAFMVAILGGAAIGYRVGLKAARLDAESKERSC